MFCWGSILKFMVAACDVFLIDFRVASLALAIVSYLSFRKLIPTAKGK